MNSLDTRIQCNRLVFDSPNKTSETFPEGSHIRFEGVLLPPMMRPGRVEATFGFGHGALYAHLNAGNIRSVALRDNPNQKRATRLIYTASVIEFLQRCEEQQKEGRK